MRDKIQELLEGKFMGSCPEIGLSPTIIEERVEESSVFSGDFFLECKEEMKGWVSCSDQRVTFPKKEFSGKTWIVVYQIGLRGLQKEDVLEGTITIITNFGEYELPYRITIGEEKPVENLFHFANFAKEDWESAVSVFGKKNFLNSLKGNDRQYGNLYRALVKEGSLEQAMDEFLVVAHKKERVTLWLEKSEEHLFPVHLGEEHYISIAKENWGYIEAEISTEGLPGTGFIKPRKGKLTMDDFIGNSCQLPYTIRQEQLHTGWNQEALVIRTPYQELRFELIVEVGEPTPLWQIENELLQYRIQFMEGCLSFCRREIPFGLWVDQSLALIDKILGLDRDNQEWQLMKIQVLYLGKREEEGKILLETFEKGRALKERNQVSYGYYLYLQACYQQDKKSIEKATAEIWKIYRQNQEPFPVLWMLFHLDKELEQNPRKKWDLLEEQFHKGCYSPLLYVEAIQLLLKEESLLRKLEDFEIHLLTFAIKKSFFKNKWVDRILGLTVKRVQFHPLLYKLYQACYKIAPNKEWLAAILAILIHGHKTGKEYLPWFELGVNQNLKIAGLFEHYVACLEYRERERLPHNLLVYYLYNENLSEHQKALLYSLIAEFKQGPSLGRYEKLIYFFVGEQLRQGNISVNLARLYNEFLEREILDQETSLEQLGSFLFIHRIKSKWPHIAKVLVVHEKLKKIAEYPWKDGQAFAPIYSREDIVVLVDEKGRKYAQETDLKAKPLLNMKKFIPYLEEKGNQSLELFLYTEIASERYRNITSKNAWKLEMFAKDHRFRKEFRLELELELLKYYQSSFQSQQLRKALKEVEIGEFSAWDRSIILEMMLGEGLYSIAYPAVCEYGFHHVDPRMLVGLLSDKIREVDFERQDDLVKLCYQVLKQGKYSEIMLQYLVLHFDGSWNALMELWEIVRGFGLDREVLAERILTRSLTMENVSIEDEEIFFYYLEQKRHNPLTLAYLSFKSYCYFVKEKPVGVEIWDVLEQQLLCGQQLPWVCKVAFLKASAVKGSLGDKVKELAVSWLMESVEKSQVYPFFKDLERILNMDLGFENQVFVEYRTRPGSKVWLHYQLETGKTEGEKEPKTDKMEAMENGFEGIYTRSFTLFYGEKLHYEITEENETESGLTQRGTLYVGEEQFCYKEHRLQMINHMIISERLEDQKALFQLLDQYISLDYLVEQMFRRL